MSDLTVMLEQIESGDAQAARRLLPLVYDELRKLAAQKMSREAPGQTLQATALVHEAWLRLGGDEQPAWQNRAHFFAAAAEAIYFIRWISCRRKAGLRRSAASPLTRGIAFCVQPEGGRPLRRTVPFRHF